MDHNEDYITKDDVFGYLKDRSPEKFDDPELEHCYDMMEEYIDRHLQTINDDQDLEMAKYWLEQAWFVEAEREKSYN